MSIAVVFDCVSEIIRPPLRGDVPAGKHSGLAPHRLRARYKGYHDRVRRRLFPEYDRYRDQLTTRRSCKAEALIRRSALLRAASIVPIVNREKTDYPPWIDFSYLPLRNEE